MVKKNLLRLTWYLLSETQYVYAVALDSKGGSSLKHVAREITKMISAIGYARVSLQRDTEPAMKQLVE